MAKKPKPSRSALPTQSRETAGNTPVASPAPDAPAAPQAAGEHLPVDVVVLPPKTTQATSEPPAAAKPQPTKQNAVATPQRTSGAGWFIPPQQPSGFGVKKD